MPLFQETIVRKYLKNQEKAKIAEKWAVFRKHFHNPTVQENIRNSKEEQYQGEFLIDLFVKILGYTKNPSPNFNLTTELKNVKDSKKADGAIILPLSVGQGAGVSSVVAVIELKGTNTTDLTKIESQAFGYKNNQTDCTYVIISNFEKLRFYVDNAIEHLEFNLFRLTEKEFEMLYLCLAFDNIKNDLPKKIKAESLNQEDTITRKLYQDYSLFKRDLYENLIKNNPEKDKLWLYKQSQKLLDRFLFIFFAEDKNLLQPNSVRNIIKRWKSNKNWGEYRPLYAQYRQFFSFMFEGLKNEELAVFPYNGGLFETDLALDSLKIDDHILHDHSLRLSDYDFNSEVDVNILGHIFENSLSEIEEIERHLQVVRTDTNNGENLPAVVRVLTDDKIDKVSKRKKDGVFYTPKYITKYIVENTVGKLCTAKKEETQIIENEYITDKKRKKEQTQFLLDKLKTYRNWLLELKIVDPACGSGAFLNEALNFLIAEHAYIDELQAKLLGDSMILSDVEKSILENNLFGVDINEESVQIARLSLWLRTARPNRKLNRLNQNIKVGNSLISDREIAGEKAFDWQKEFPQVFKPSPKSSTIGEETSTMFKPSPKSSTIGEVSHSTIIEETSAMGLALADSSTGFDVVIGNPPYVLCQPSNTDENTLNFYKKFEVASYKIDLFHLFFEKSINLLKTNGKLGFITPNTYLTNKYIQKLRNFILTNTFIDNLVNYNETVFVDAGVDVATLILTKSQLFNEKIEILNFEKGELKLVSAKSQQSWFEDSEQVFNLQEAFIIKFENCATIEQIGNTYFGIQAYDRTSSISTHKINNDYLPMIDGADIFRFQPSISNKYFNFIPKNIKSGGDWNIYSKDRIVIRQIGQTPIIGFCEAEILTSNTIYNLFLTDDQYDLKYVFCILNSTLIKSYWLSKYSDNKDLFPKIKGYQLKQLPIKKIPLSDQSPFIEKADLMLRLHKDFQILSKKVQDSIQREFSLSEFPRKLENWHDLTYADFLKEIDKQKVKLTLCQKSDWEEYFVMQQEKIQSLKSQIQATDRQIDDMVFDLYGLTAEERALVV